MVKLSVNWYGKDKIIGGCEEFFEQFKLIDKDFQHVNFERAAKALHGAMTEKSIQFFEIDGGIIIDQYLIRYEKMFKPEIIVKNGWCGGFLKLNTPVIAVHQDLHHTGANFLYERGLYNPIEFNRIGIVFSDLQRRNAHLAKKNIAVSEFVKDELKHLGIVVDKVIPHGVDLNQFKPMDKAQLREDYKKEFGITKDKVGLWVGRFHPQKGWHIMADLIRAYPDVHWLCLFSGIPTSQPRLPNVTFVNPVRREEMVKLYNIADFYVMTSGVESFSLTTLESAACGTPVLGYNTGILKHEKGFGLTTDEWSPEGFKPMIDKVLEGKKFTPRRAAEKYSIEKWKKAWKAII